MDDDVKLTQSMAILKYLGRKHNLIPRNEADVIRIDLILYEALDMRHKLDVQCYGNFEVWRYTELFSLFISKFNQPNCIWKATIFFRGLSESKSGFPQVRRSQVKGSFGLPRWPALFCWWLRKEAAKNYLLIQLKW